MHVMSCHVGGREYHEEYGVRRLPVFDLLVKNIPKYIVSCCPHNLDFSSIAGAIIVNRLFAATMGNCVCYVDGTGEVNWKGVAYYNRLINYMVKKGKCYLRSRIFTVS
jgi:hypothetical protein